MARTELPIVVLNPSSPYNPVSGASAAVLNRSDLSTATVYSGETGGSTLSQPLTTDANGRLTGWLERGAYVVQVSIPGHPTYDEPLDSSPAADGSIATSWVADGAVSTAKVADGAVTAAKVASNAITSAKVDSSIKDPAVGTAGLRTLGTGSTQATAGNDSRLSDQRTPLDNSVSQAKMLDSSVGQAEAKMVVSNTTGSPTALTTTNDTSIATVTPVAGTYLVVVRYHYTLGGGSSAAFTARLKVAGSTVDFDVSTFITSAMGASSLFVARAVTVGGSDIIAATAQRSGGNTSDTASVAISILGISA